MQVSTLLISGEAPINVYSESNYSKVEIKLDPNQEKKYAKSIRMIIEETKSQGEFDVYISTYKLEVSHSNPEFWNSLKRNLFSYLSAYVKEA
jgi:hypothetical protein